VRSPALAALVVTGVLATASARADDDEFATAVAEFDAADKALTTTAPCDTMCKALQSMIRAADRICELARDGNATEQKRCTDAKAKVAEATSRVRASCPNCDPSPPYAPSTAEKPKPDEAKVPAAGKAPPPSPMVDEPTPPREESVAFAAGVARGRTSTISLDVIPLFAPPALGQLRFERAVSSRFSFAIVGGIGSLPKTGPQGSGRTSAFGVGGELRGYLFGSFDRFGLFVGADVMFRSANNVAPGEYVEARAFPLGLTAGALVGTKLVLGGGFTVEARIGPSFVVDDRRDGGPRPKVLPSGGVSLGWTF